MTKKTTKKVIKKKATVKKVATKKVVAKKKIAKKKITAKKSKGMIFEYDDAPESTKVVIDKKYGNFIDGEFVLPKSGKYIDTVNPATGEVLTKIASSNAEDVDLAVKVSRLPIHYSNTLKDKEINLS